MLPLLVIHSSLQNRTRQSEAFPVVASSQKEAIRQADDVKESAQKTRKEL
jgi:hypothetical protein